jgi:hypothetical protein
MAAVPSTNTGGVDMLTKRQNLLAGTFFLGGTASLGYALMADPKEAKAWDCANDCSLDWFTGTYYQCTKNSQWPSWMCQNQTQPGYYCLWGDYCGQSGISTSGSGSG